MHYFISSVGGSFVHSGVRFLSRGIAKKGSCMHDTTVLSVLQPCASLTLYDGFEHA